MLIRGALANALGLQVAVICSRYYQRKALTLKERDMI